MKENDLNKFLKENNAIFSYLKDDNGNRIGVIIATPGKDEPKIGFAFFSEVAETNDVSNLYEKLTYVGDAPYFKDEITRVTGGKPSMLDKVKLPVGVELYRFRPEKINKKDTIFLARQRVNTNREKFYVTDNKNDFQKDTVLYSPKGKNEEFISGNHITRRYSADRAYISRTSIDYVTCPTLRKQIKAFEYRALRYYKIVIPSYKK